MSGCFRDGSGFDDGSGFEDGSGFDRSGDFRGFRGFRTGCGSRRRRRRCTREFRRLLAELRGSGFTVSIVTRGAHFAHQKVVGFEDNVVFTANREGCVRATCIDKIDSVDF